MKITFTKICSLLLALALMLPAGFVFAAETATTAPKMSDATAAELGILETLEIYFAPTTGDVSTKATRGELAEALGVLMEISPSVKQQNRYFTDLPETHIANELVEYGFYYEIGRRFDENKTLTYSEAAENLVKVLGYSDTINKKGGFAADYVSLATRLGISTGVSNRGELTKADLIRMLYNTLEANVCELSSVTEGNAVYTETEVLFREARFNLYDGRGIVAANKYTSIYQNVAATEDDSLVIDGKRYACLIEGCDEFIGQKVKFYYIDDDVDEIIYIAPDTNSEDITVSYDNIGGYANGRLTYYDKSSQKTIDFSSNTVYIKNGQAYFAVLESDLRSWFQLKRGNVIIRKNDKQVTCVIINAYENAIVTGVDANRGCIFVDAYGTSYTLDTKEASCVSLMNADGGGIDISAVAMNNIVTFIQSENGEYIKLYSTASTFTGKADSVKNTGKTVEVKVGEATYKVDCGYYDYKAGKPIKVGVEYTFRLDSFGNIAMADSMLDTWSVGYLAGVKAGENFDASQIQIYDITVGKAEIFELDSKIKLDINTAVEHKTAAATLEGHVGEVVRYFVNAKGKVKSIDTAASAKEAREGENTLWKSGVKMSRVYRGDTEYPSSGFYKFMPDASETGSLGYAIDNQTKMLIADGDIEDWRLVAPGTYLENGITYEVAMYKYDDSTPYTDVIVANENYSLPGKGSTCWLVNQLYKSYENEEVVVKMEALAGTHSGSTEDVTFSKNVDICGNTSATVSTVIKTVDALDILDEIGSGDIIQQTLDNDGKVCAIRLMYDYSTDTTHWGKSYDSQSYSTWASDSTPSTDRFRSVFGNLFEKYEQYDTGSTVGFGDSVLTLSDPYNDNAVMERYTLSVSYGACAVYDADRRSEDKAYYGRISYMTEAKYDPDNCTKVFIHWSNETPTSKIFYK